MTDLFSNVTNAVGLTWNGEPSATSVAWIDFDQDGYADIWASPHGYKRKTKAPKLFQQQEDGTFRDILRTVWPKLTGRDIHGTGWADFDNDGDPDLAALAGANAGVGQQNSFLFVNQAGVFEDRAVSLGVAFPQGRGRNPLWLDWNQDGLLDLIHINSSRPDGLAPSTLFQQTATGFVNVNTIAGFQAPEDGLFAQTADLFGNGKPDIILMRGGSTNNSPLRVYETGSSTLTDLTDKLPRFSRVRDVAIADFNGDTIPDLFLLRSKRSAISHFYQGESKILFGKFLTQSEAGVNFKATGSVSVEFHNVGVRLTPAQIFIGAEGFNPSTSNFSVSPTDPRVVGLRPRTAKSPFGLYMGYDPATETWQAILANPDGRQRTIELMFDASASINTVNPIGFTAPNWVTKEGVEPVLLIYDQTKRQYVDKTRAAGLGTLMVGRSVVAGDFDNDMDVDLYITNGSQNIPLPSLFYTNQGDGTFVPVENAAGATIQPAGAFTFSGYGDLNAVTADYNRDGFLDIFVGNTTLEGTQRNYMGTPYQLYRNNGNPNHWLQIDLQGTLSNRDGIGAKVLVTAGGKTQMREQSGGMHAYSQDFQVLHFGLGDHSQIERIAIHWPSGLVQELTNVEADQVLSIVEPSQPMSNLRSYLQGTDALTGHSSQTPLIGGNRSFALSPDQAQSSFWERSLQQSIAPDQPRNDIQPSLAALFFSQRENVDLVRQGIRETDQGNSDPFGALAIVQALAVGTDVSNPSRLAITSRV